MKNNGRRAFLGKMAAGCAGLVAAPFLYTKDAFARKMKHRKPQSVGMLYDATICIGCKACEAACKKANGMPPETDPSGLWDAPRDLSSKTMNIVKLYKAGDKYSFIKRQCMHCVDPACVSGCPTSAMTQREDGVVVWDSEACVGCRYCQMDCQFSIPKYEFESKYGRIVKCELCSKNGLLEKGQTACTNACPTGAVIFGKQKDLLKTAKKRLAKNPEKYNGSIYGDTENGGTGVIYLAGVPFEDLGLPNLPDYSTAKISEGIQHTIYQNMVAPIAIYFTLIMVAFKNLRTKQRDKE